MEGRLLAALRVLLASDMETAQKHDLNTLKSLSAEAPLGIAKRSSCFPHHYRALCDCIRTLPNQNNGGRIRIERGCLGFN